MFEAAFHSVNSTVCEVAPDLGMLQGCQAEPMSSDAASIANPRLSDCDLAPCSNSGTG